MNRDSMITMTMSRQSRADVATDDLSGKNTHTPFFSSMNEMINPAQLSTK